MTDRPIDRILPTLAGIAFIAALITVPLCFLYMISNMEVESIEGEPK